MSKTVAATAFAFCLSTTAFAAMSTATTTGGVPADWPAALKSAFFADASGTKLRSQEEIRAKWASLTTARKTQVQTDCQKTASAGTSNETTASTTKKSTTGTMTKGTMAAGDQMATMDQLCTWVKGM